MVRKVKPSNLPFLHQLRITKQISSLAVTPKLAIYIAMYSILPENHFLHRNNRLTRRGSFNDINETLIASSMPDINTNCEVV